MKTPKLFTSIIFTLVAVASVNATQAQKLTAFDGAAGDQFGFSVALDGSTALIGALGDDDNGSNSGSAYIFQDTSVA